MREAYFFTAGLCVGYGHRPVVSDITMEVAPGEILTLIGPNGAGKSTLLKSIARQLAPLGGVMMLGGEKLSDLSREETAKNMAVLLTNRSHESFETCEEMVAKGRYPYTGRFGILSKQDKEKVAEAMELVGITDLRTCPFSQLSDGQCQRVLLARAIAQEPRLLLLDEPTSYLDVRYKLEFLSILQRLCKRKNMSVILSLHELELARRVSDRLLCIRDGAVVHFGRPEEIFTEGVIRQLFGITEGSYEELTDTLELAAPAGEPKVFVIGGGGDGLAVYRSLQRQGIPFAAGILQSNDLELPTARALASEVYVAQAFEPVEQELYQQAKRRMDACERVICGRKRFGSLEQANRALADYAAKTGKLNR